MQESIDYYGSLLWTLARRFCGDYESARDATCDIFKAIWNHAGEFDPSEQSELSFVVTIARRQLFQRRQRELTNDDRLRLGQAMLKPMVGADGSFELFDEPRSVASALERLRPEQREVLELALVYGRRYDEIAASDPDYLHWIVDPSLKKASSTAPRIGSAWARPLVERARTRVSAGALPAALDRAKPSASSAEQTANTGGHVKTFRRTCKTTQSTDEYNRCLSTQCGRSSVVEHQLPKLSVEGSIPFARSSHL